MSTIGERILCLRKDLKLTQDQLAEMIGKTKSNVSGYENDKFEPSAKTIISLCKVFNVSSDFLLFGVNHEVLKIEQNEQISFTTSEIEFIKKLNRLDSDERTKIEGIIEGVLMAKEMQSAKKATSSISKNGEEAATDETA